jgi:DNA replication protein DnaC
MTPHDLRPSLQRLQWSGILATMDIRLHEAETQRWGYLACLQRLCLDEIERCEQQTLARRVAAARFEQVQTLSPVDFTDNPEIPAPVIRDLATCAFLRRQESVILAGAVGLGKTHLGQALGNAACQQGDSVAYRKTPALFADLGGGHADGTYERR